MHEPVRPLRWTGSAIRVIDHAALPGRLVRTSLERVADEILAWGGVHVAPDGSRAYNPAFGVMPARLISTLVTDQGVLEIRLGCVPANRAEPVLA